MIEKCYAKRVPKTIKVGAKNVPRLLFYDFGVFFGEQTVLRFVGRNEVDPNSNKIRNMRPEGRPDGIFGGGMSEKAGPG